MADFRVMLPLAAARLDRVLQTGEYKHGDNWKTLTVTQHLQHAMEHIRRHIELGELCDVECPDELNIEHALTRLGFAVEQLQRELEAEKRERRRAKRRETAQQRG